MKLIRPFVGLATCGAMMFAMAFDLAAQTAEQGTAKVVSVRGSARYKTADNPNVYRPLKAGLILKAGTTIQTASDSSVDIVLNNPNANQVTGLNSVGGGSSSLTPAAYSPSSRTEQDAVRILANSVLAIDKLTVTQTGADRITDTQLDLQNGRILATVKKMSPASRYEIKIPNGVAGIRGTVIYLDAAGILAVLRGSAGLGYLGMDNAALSQLVASGQQFDTRTGQLTPIVDSIMAELMSAIAQLDFSALTTDIVFTIDRTVYFLSTVRPEE